MSEGSGAPDRPRKDLREQFVQKAMSDCRHFTGASNSTCRAGVNYRQLVGGEDLGWMRRLPCVRAFQPDDRFPVVTCEHRSPMTREEAEQEADREIARMERFGKAHKAAKDDAKAKGLKRGHGGEGAVACPCCEGGTIRYTVASLNGHMWAACSTKGCVSWME